MKGFHLTVAIVGIGHTDFRSTSPDISFKEQMFEAAENLEFESAAELRDKIRELKSIIG